MEFTKYQLSAVANFYKEHLKNPPPEMRNMLLYLADDAHDNKDIQGSVYFQTEAMCNSLDCKSIFKVNNLNLYSDNFLTDVILPNSFIENHSNSLLKFAKEKFLNEIETASKNLRQEFNLEEKILKIKLLLKNMPSEWTIIQLTRGYNENMCLQSRKRNLTSNIPIYLSILKHSRNSLDGNFICIKKEFENEEIYSKFFEIQETFKSFSLNILKAKESIAEYHKKILPLENGIIIAIEKLEKEFGPWCCLFSGSLKNKKLEMKIFENVDNFCQKNRLNNRIKIILSLLLSEPTKLTTENCKLAAEYLSRNNTKRLSNILETFLVKTAKELSQDEIVSKMQLRFPCLIIVDEILDHFPWEFLNKSQEFCRIASLNLLQQIFDKHKFNINEGYLRIKAENGNFLVNPENNLKDAENRIRLFGDYWLPNFDYLYGEKPSHDKIKEIFNSHGVYIYCGHGHGIDYLNPHKLGFVEIMNPVSFLFGCESVKLSSKTNYGEMNGEHLYFHKGLCPAVIGCIHIAFDFSLDLIATEILSTWILSKQKVHWQNIDKEHWRKGIGIVPTKKIQNRFPEYDPRLAAILSRIRLKGSQKYYHLIPLVYRGIPVWNTKVKFIS